MKLSKEDRKRIQESIKQKYAKVSTDPSGQFRYPTGRAGLEALAYDRETIEALSDSVVDAFCGVGNPFALGPIKTGERVLDIGCGAGVDAFIAASMVRAEGKVAGIDMVPEMIERAKQNLLETTLKNVSFQQASAENLPFPNDSFDVALSNGVFNLIPDKVKALSEVFRVLRPGGRMMLADQILSAPITGDKSERIESWFRWEGGAIPGMDFLALLEQVGFTAAELVAETGLNSSQVTNGALFRAIKPTVSLPKGKEMEVKDLLSQYQAFFEQAYADGALDRKTKHLIALGASLGAGCEVWTKYCLAVARELGATDEELKETMAIAMTVGATKIQILQESSLANMPAGESDVTQTKQTDEAAANHDSCSAWPTQSSSGWAAPKRIRKQFSMSRETVNILLLLPQGFEDLEAVTILDVFGWTQYREHLPKVLVTKTGFHEVVTGRFGTTIRCDIPLEGIKPQLYHALVLPGGFHSYGFDEAYDVRIHKLAREIHQNGGYIASMCVGILPIADAGLLRGKKATTYPYSRNHDNVDRLKSSGARMVKYHMVMDNRIISCDGRGSSLNVAFLLMESLIAPEMTRELRKYMIYDPKS